MVLCASTAGALGGLAGNPAGESDEVNMAGVDTPDIVLVRMVADPTKPAEHQVRYRNALHGVYRMVTEEGVSSLFRGLAPNTVRPPDRSRGTAE